MTKNSSADLASELASYPRRYCSVCDNLVPKQFGPGPNGRPNASCPRCGSLERQRFFGVLLSVLAPSLGELDVLLEVAPSKQTTPLLRSLNPKTFVRLDLGADNRLVDVLGSVTELPHRDRSVDLLMCYHVLEHVPDDRAAMREIARVLAPEGLALLQVPFRPNADTDEDPSAGPEERLRRFGQEDHVRYYGRDFEQRLVESGLTITRVTPLSLLGPAMSTWLHLNPDEVVWLARPAAGAEVPEVKEWESTTLTRTADAMLSEMLTLRARLVKHRRANDKAGAPTGPRRPQHLVASVKSRVRAGLRKGSR
jgi:SAM-dependent methyltransferase